MSDAPSAPDTRRWDHRALLLLGVLTTQRQHGYLINDFIEQALTPLVSLKKPTAYAILDRLADGGFVSMHVEQVGHRPPRKVYAITPAGRQLFDALLRQNLATPDVPVLAGDVGLMFLRHLPREEVLAALRERLARLETLLAEVDAVPPHRTPVTLDLALDHVTTLRRADRDWLVATIRRLEDDGDGAGTTG